jgi:hypothetical protein
MSMAKTAKTLQNIHLGPWRVKPSAVLLLAMLAAYSLARLWLVWDVELGKDEAAYWYWGQHLDATYALLPFALIGAAHLLLPGHEWFLRLPSLLAGAAAAALLWRHCRLYGLSAPSRLGAVAAFAGSHWIWHATSYLHPDAFLAFCWLWALSEARRSLDAPQQATYVRMGLALGLCLLCKYSAAFLAVGIILWLLLTIERHRLVKVLTAVALPCALVALPLGLAQLNTGFYLPTTLSTLSRIVEDQPLPLRLLLFVLNPLTFVSPLLLWLLYRAFGRLVWTWRRLNPEKLLALLPALCLCAGFAFFALSRGQIKGNWILPGFLGLWPVAFAAVSRRWIVAVVGIGLLQALPIAVGLKYPGLAAALSSRALDQSYVSMVSTPDRQREPSYSWSERLGEYHGWNGLATAIDSCAANAGLGDQVPLVSSQYGTVFATAYYSGRPIYTVDDPRFHFLTDFSVQARPHPGRLLFVVRQGTPVASSLDSLYPHRDLLASLPRKAPGCPLVYYDIHLFSMNATKSEN